MKVLKTLLVFSIVVFVSAALIAQTPVTPNAKSPEELAKSSNKQLEANKMLVLNLFREVLEARHIELATSILRPTSFNTIRTLPTAFRR